MDLKQIKANRTKSTLSTVSFSSTKMSSKVRLSEILEYMSLEYPLSDLAELLEKETDGKFTQLTFREIIDRVYPDLSISDKIFLIKHLPLSKIGITPYSPLIFLLYLFKYIESIIKIKIISPSLIFYDIAEKLKYKYNMSTIEFFHSLNLEPEKEITIDDFYLYLGSKIISDKISEIVLFKSIDYDKDDKIKIEDLILVIDSYRNDNLDDKDLAMDNTAKKNVLLLKNFMEKNMICLDLIYEKADYNYMKFNDLKSILVNEIYNYKRFANIEDTQINESIVDNVLSVIKRDNKIFKNDLKNYLGEFIFNSNNNNSDKDNNEINVIELNYNQKYWINKYLDLIYSIKSTPQIIFNSSLKQPDTNVTNILDLLKQILRLSPNGKLNSDEMTQIMNALDINNTGLIEINQYEIIINQIQDIKNKIESKLKSKESLSNKLENIYSKEIINIWSKGVKSPYYHLLPTKGNYEVLEKVNKDIKNNLIFDDKENDINTNNITNKKVRKIGKTNKNNIFKEEKQIEGDKGAIFEEKNKNTGEVEKFYVNDKSMATEKIELINEYSEEELVRNALENFNFETIYFSDNDLLLHLEKNKIGQKTREDVVRYIDNNDDELISVIDLFKFLLYKLKYKSIKLVLKYLYIKIYKELKMKSSYQFFKNNQFNIQKKINLNKLIKFFELFYIDSPLTKKIYETLEYKFKYPILYIHLCQLIDEYENDLLINGKNNSNEKVDNRLDNNNKLISFNIDNLDNEMKNIVRNLIDVKDYKGNDSLRCKNLNEKIDDMLIDCPENMNYSQFEEHFGKKIDLNISMINIIFHLLKHTSLKGERQQLISKNDLLMFLQMYCCEEDKSNFINGFNNNKKEDENEEGLSLSQIKNIITTIEQNGPPIKYSFEKLPFRGNGLVSCAEIINYIDIFYNNSIPKKDLIKIISCIDEDKIGVVNYSQLQIFLNNYSNVGSFSGLLEIQIIASNLYKKNYIKSERYFKQMKKIDNIKEINKKKHNIILSRLCSNKKNKERLFNYLLNISGSKFYDLKLLTNKIDELLQKDSFINLESNKYLQNDENEEEDLGLPDKIILEKALKLINLGPKGNVSINELLLKMEKGYRKALSKKIDRKHIGYLTFPTFINKVRNIYGTDIKLNYKLCAQYLYKVFILSPSKV